MNPIPLVLAPLQASPQQSPLSMLLPMGMIFLIFYFLLIRPQAKRQKEQEAMLKAIEKNDAIVTAGGLHGKVVGVTEDVLTVEIADKVRVKVARTRVESVVKAKKGGDS